MSARRERPILFSGPMVRAIIEGRKTQTRRIVRPGQDVCPYGVPGDRLWVRETFSRDGASVICRADGDREGVKWRPSIFMRRAESRLTLQVVATRRESLHGITESDARSEGLRDRHTFSVGWDSINGRRGPWHENPLVWVVLFSLELT